MKYIFLIFLLASCTNTYTEQQTYVYSDSDDVSDVIIISGFKCHRNCSKLYINRTANMESKNETSTIAN